jgi:hypothetical protein
MSKSVGVEYLRPEPITDVARRLPHGDAAQDARVENASQGMRPNDSLVKARYAWRVLRVAQTTDTNTAARLVGGLARDLPLPNELPRIMDIHLGAIDSFIQLASSLNAATDSERLNVWKAALDATAGWLRVVEAEQ